jgi:hypothetical protein
MGQERQDQISAPSTRGSLIVLIEMDILICAFACSFWIVYLAYETKGSLIAIVVLPIHGEISRCPSDNYRFTLTL